MNILVVEDEPKVAAFIAQGLELNGHTVKQVNDGITGRDLALSENFDLVILDVIMPGLNGVDVCKAIRASKADVPVLMLTALGTVGDKVKGLDAGADDYLVKPFEFQELMARVRSLGRRSTGQSKPVNKLAYSGLELDLNKKIALREGKEITLTAKEFALLEFMMRNPERVLSRSEISDNVWDVNFDTGTNIVDVYVNILRKKIDKDFSPKLIQTRVGLGYMLQAG